jgi:hypothetical protein
MCFLQTKWYDGYVCPYLELSARNVTARFARDFTECRGPTSLQQLQSLNTEHFIKTAEL